MNSVSYSVESLCEQFANCTVRGIIYIVVQERGGTPFRQIFLSRNGAPVNLFITAGTLILRRSGKSAHTIKSYTKFGQLVFSKIIEIDCHHISYFNSISAGAPPQNPLRELTALPRPHSWI